ncbi:MAG: monooxygenase, partial [Bradyrhizobium sp.]
AFAGVANGLGVPLKTVRDTYEDGRKAYEAKLILVRPDRYVAWASDAAPNDAKEIVSKAVGRA